MKTKVFDKSKREALKRMGFDVEAATQSDVTALKSRRIKPLLDSNPEQHSQAIANIRKSFANVRTSADSDTKKDSKEGEQT